MGKLSNLVTQSEVTNLLNKYGTVESINMVAVMSCAFIKMDSRENAVKAIKALKGTVLKGRVISVRYKIIYFKNKKENLAHSTVGI